MSVREQALTGTVTFNDGNNSLGTGSLNGSEQATFTTAALPAGTHTITAVYASDSNFAASTAATITQTVTQVGTTTTLTTISSSPSVAHAAVSFTVTVSATDPLAGTPTGTVTFSDGSTSIGTAGFSSHTSTSGTAVFSITTLSVGTHTITAAYSGDSNFITSSSSSSIIQQVTRNTLPLTWIGTTGSNWSTPGNWNTGYAPLSGDDLIFATTASGSTIDDIQGLSVNSITITGSGYTLSSTAGTLNLGGVLTNTGTGTNTISAVIGGSGGIIQAGGTLTLTAANTFTGNTTINAGTLTLSGSGTATNVTSWTVNQDAKMMLDNSGTVNSSRIGSSANLTLAGGTFDLKGASTTGTTVNQYFGQLTLKPGFSTVTVEAAWRVHHPHRERHNFHLV